MLRKTFIICGLASLLVLISFGVDRFYTNSFSLANISFENTSYMPPIDSFKPTDYDNKLIINVLNQPFCYLGQGNQTYAFIGADGTTVLKFFKFGHLKPSFFFKTSDLSQEKRFFKIFAGTALAFEYNRDNTGLLYIHLNKSNNLQLKVDVTDRLGFVHKINLDDVVFVVQKKITPTRQELARLFDQGDVEEVKKRLSTLLALYLSEYSRGIYDRDHNLMDNTGFDGTKALRLDVGKLRKDPLALTLKFQKDDLTKIASERLLKWTTSYYPVHREKIKFFLEQELSSIFHEPLTLP